MTSTSNINTLHRALILHQQVMDDIRLTEHLKDCQTHAMRADDRPWHLRGYAHPAVQREGRIRANMLLTSAAS